MSFFQNEYSRFLHIVLYCVLVTITLLFLVLMICVVNISGMSVYTYALDEIDKIPYNKTGLVLGTSKYLVKGGVNKFFSERIEAAATLFKAGKINYIVVSGDNAHPSYNEPKQMRKALIALGVPKDHIYLDYAGFRTLDSVIRIERVFRQRNVTIISQEFQNDRAIYIARHHNINAIGLNAEGIKDSFFTDQLREFFARIKCVLDVYVFNSQPKFLGDAIKIGDQNIDPKHAQMLMSGSDKTEPIITNNDSLGLDAPTDDDEETE